MSKLACKLGVLSRTDGSAFYSEGETVVMAGIYGPVEVRLNKIQVDKASVEVYCRPKTGLPGVKDRLQESIIRGICESAIAVGLYPRSSVVIVIQEMQNCGQLLSCGVNAACMAALNAGLDMKYMFAAATCFLDKQDTLKIVPTMLHETPKASFMFVFDSIHKGVLASNTEGSFTTEQYKEALKLCREHIENVFNFFRTSVLTNNK